MQTHYTILFFVFCFFCELVGVKGQNFEQCDELELIIESLLSEEVEYEIDSVQSLCDKVIENQCECIPQSYNLLGYVHYNHSNFHLARKYLAMAETANHKSNKNKRYSALNHTYKGLILIVEKELKPAIFHFNRGRELALESGDKRIIALAHLNLGLVRLEMNDLEQASLLFNKTIETKTANLELVAYAYMNLARVSLLQRNHEETLKSINRAKELWNIINHHKGRYFLSMIEASNYLILNDLDKALQILLEGRKIRNENSTMLLLGENHFIEASIYRAQNNEVEEIRALNYALNYSSGLEFEKIKAAVHRLNFLTNGIQSDSTTKLLLNIIKNYKRDSKVSTHNNIEQQKLLDLELNEKNIIEKDYYKKLSTIKQQFILLSLLLIFFVILIILLFNLMKHKKVIDTLNKNLLVSFNQIEEKNKYLSEKKVALEAELKNKLHLMIDNQRTFEEIRNIISDDTSISYSTRKDIISILKSENNKKILKELEFQMLNVHKDFFTKLAQIHPNLTNNNMKLCLYLKMNLSTKEIASLTFSSSDSIKVARSRLRKKLGLNKSSGVKLSGYLNSLLKND